MRVTMGRVGSLGHYDTNHYGDCPGGWIMGYRGGTRDSQEARGSRPLRTSRPSISDSMVLVGNTPGRSILSFYPFSIPFCMVLYLFTLFYPLLPLFLSISILFHLLFPYLHRYTNRNQGVYLSYQLLSGEAPAFRV